MAEWTPLAMGGIATRKPHRVPRLAVNGSAQQLTHVLRASVERMQVMARACVHDHRSSFTPHDQR